MRPYQDAYLALLRSAARSTGPAAEKLTPDGFVEATREAARASRDAVEQGTQLLRRELFPVLDDILAASDGEAAALAEFAEALMGGSVRRDPGLNYRIHLALMTRARHRRDRDGLIRELYLVGMALFNLEHLLSSPSMPHLYANRMRMYFAECASYFDTQYDEITDPEIRGYIHRSMGNIALGYDTSDAKSAMAKLTAVTRSINIASDPDIRAKTPSLPWDTYVYKSHQERTSLLSFLRSGLAEPEMFAQVLESAQIVQERQLRAARDRGEPLHPRWQYAYMAARYHCGAMLLPELLDGLYGLSTVCGDDDMSSPSMFSHVSAPAFYFAYSRQLPGGRYDEELAVRTAKMTRRLFSWIVRFPSNDNEQLLFNIKQFLYAYRELPGGMPFFDVLQNALAVRCPAVYARMWVAGQAARELTLWAAEDCPERLAGLPGFRTVQDVIWRREELADFACRAGRLYDAGMIHFVELENSACRGLFEEEEALIQLHAHCGAVLLGMHPSTAVFADIARGHHRHFDEKGGYPVDLSLRDSPVLPMVSIVAVADALVSSIEETASRYRPAAPFDQVCAQLEEERGARYAPFVTDLLRTPGRRERLREQLDAWKREAYLDMYRLRAEMLALKS